MNTQLERRRSGLAVRASLFILCMLLFGAGSAGALGQEKIDPSPNAKNGQEAIDSLGVKLPQVAGAYGLTADELKILFLTDPTLYVDSNGELFYADEPFPEDLAASVAKQPGMDAAPFDPSQTFLLHSLPGASHVIYLDFDGHTTVAGTSWNGGASIVSPPYDIDGDPNTFNAAEIERIQISWQIVSEDYSPYDIDVTTEDPGSAALSYQGSGDIYYGTRVVVTDDTWANCGCGGHAYIGSFDDYLDEPVFVYNQSLAGVAEATMLTTIQVAAPRPASTTSMRSGLVSRKRWLRTTANARAPAVATAIGPPPRSTTAATSPSAMAPARARSPAPRPRAAA